MPNPSIGQWGGGARDVAVVGRKEFGLPNKNYQAGRRFEYEVMSQLRVNGYKVLRAAGSHGEFDVVGYKADSAIFAQCKVVEDVTTAKRMKEAWRKSPPNPPNDFVGIQQLWIKVKGTSQPIIVSA